MALIRDHRRQVPAPSGDEDEGNDQHFAQWREGWKAQPSPAAPTMAKLIPIVTTAEAGNAGELAQIFQLPGLVTVDQSTVSVTFRPFNDRQLNEDLTMTQDRDTCKIGQRGNG